MSIRFSDPPVETPNGLEWYGINIRPPDSGGNHHKGVYVGFAQDRELRENLFRQLPVEEKRTVTISKISEFTLHRLADSDPVLVHVMPNNLYDMHAGVDLYLTPAEFAWASWQKYIDLWASCEITADWILKLIDKGFHGLDVEPITSKIPF